MCSGCSFVEKNLFLKPLDKSGDWKMIKYRNYTENVFWANKDFAWGNHQYYSCDSTSSIVIYFSRGFKSLFSGPPLIPILPVFPVTHNTHDFNVRVIIKTRTFKDAENLSNHFHFYFNDPLNFISPTSKRIIEKNDIIVRKNYSHLCNESITNESYSINFYFKLEPYKLKKVTIKFDEEFNKQLNSNYKTLNLLGKSRLHYWPFYISTS